MQVRSKLLFKTAIIMLGVVLMLGVYLSMSSINKAKGMSATQWETVRTYINKYITDQYLAADEGEAGYLAGKVTMQTQLDSNLNGTYLGEGDDALNAPILIDNLMQLTTLIPGTSYRCRWTAGTDGGNCLNTSTVTDIKGLVDAHKAAGFSTDIIVYCGTGHTEAPVTGAFGFLAQTGGLASDASIPKVYAMKWGRAGWTNTLATYPNTNTSAGPETPATNVDPTNAQCGSAVGDVELVRCMASWALQSTSVGGGNVGNGADTTTVAAAGQTVDVRTGTLTNGVSSAGSNIQVPINTLFNTDRAKISPTATTIIASRSPMVGGIVAEGTKMLGYNMMNATPASTANSFISGGLPTWNNTIAGKQVAEGSALGLLAVAAYTAPAKVDTLNPSISSSSATATGTTTANIVRTTSEPATSKIALTGSGGAPAVNVNNTVLNVNKTTALTGLVPGTTYTGTLTVYDAQANSASRAISFTTLAPADITPPVTTNNAPAGWQTANVTVTLSCTDAGSGCASTSWTATNGGGSGTGNTVVVSNEGATVISYHSTDVAGNVEAPDKTVTVAIDKTAPSVTGLAPTGTVTSSSTTISGSYADLGSGINSTTAAVTRDGLPVAGCTATATGISCPVSGLADGLHTYTVSVADNAGNTGSSSNSFTVSTCTPARPNLGIRTGSVSWASYADYSAGELSVQLIVSNTGTTTGYGVAITGSANTNGVTLSTATPIALGDIAAGGSASAVVKYHIPVSVTGFSATIGGSASDSCGTGYTYPAPQ